MKSDEDFNEQFEAEVAFELAKSKLKKQNREERMKKKKMRGAQRTQTPSDVLPTEESIVKLPEI